MEDKKIQLLSIGDATWDVFIIPSEAETFCTLDTFELQLCFNYGDKIPVKELDFSIGGNAANNAIGARRLGIRSSLLITIGDDLIAKMMEEKFKAEDVDLTYLTEQKDTNSNYSTIINVMGERTILTYNTPVEYHLPEQMPDADWIYLTSMGENFHETYSKVADWVRDNSNVKMAFNPGSRQVRAEPDSYKSVLEQTHIIYINREEAEMITGMKETNGKEKELMEKLRDMGAKMSVVTDGGKGAYAFDGEKFYHADVFPVDPYEKTGAGDSFGAGMISALISGKDMKEALLWGTCNSASVIGYVGSQKGLLTEEQMQEWVERAISSEVAVEEI